MIDFFYVNNIYVFRFSKKYDSTTVLRLSYGFSSKKCNIYIQKDFQTWSLKDLKSSPEVQPTHFLHVGFFEAPSFFVLVYHHPKGKAPIVFYMFFFPFPWEYLYICIYIYMFRNLPPWKPFTNLITNPSPTPSIPIHPGELPDLQAHPHDNTRRAWLQGLDWSCPGEPIRGGDPGVCGPCCCFLFAPQKKGWRFCWKPGNPHQKKEKKVGTFMEENPENNWMFHSCYVGNGPGYKHVKPAQASYTNSIPRSRLESGCWLTHQRSMVDKAIPARRPKIRVHQPERDWKCVKMIRNCFWIQRTLDLASRHMRATWLLSYRYI